MTSCTSVHVGSLTFWTESGIMRDSYLKTHRRSRRKTRRTKLMAVAEILLMSKSLLSLCVSLPEECSVRPRSSKMLGLLSSVQVTLVSLSSRPYCRSATFNSPTLCLLLQVVFPTTISTTEMTIWSHIQRVTRAKSSKSWCLKVEWESSTQGWWILTDRTKTSYCTMIRSSHMTLLSSVWEFRTKL